MFSACTTPHIQNNNNILEITMKDKSIVKGSGKILYENRVNLLNINVLQKVYRMDNGSILTYEDAPVSTAYVYSYGMKRTVGIVFPQYSNNLIDIQGNIFFFKLTNEKSTLYMILENINKKRIKFVYGLDQNLFQSIYSSLATGSKVLKNNKSDDSENIQEDKTIYIKSRWNNKNIILDGIITKTGGMSNPRM